MSLSNESLPLFESVEDQTDGIGAFQAAMDAWVTDHQSAGLLRKAGSEAIYRDMWSAFATWCIGQSPRVTLARLTPEDLDHFSAARYGRKSADGALSAIHALRLAQLINRILRHHLERQGVPANTAVSDWLAARPDVRYAAAAGTEALPEYLSVTEARRLILYLSEARPRPGADLKMRTAITWQDLRNRASVALQLGAGLTPGDVRSLTLDSPVSQGGRVRNRPWKVLVPSDGTSPAREAPVAAWAAELLQHWLSVRANSGIAGSYLFPSTRTGKPWLKDSQYICARRVLEAAGVDSTEGGSFRLRHTFALRQLRRGTEPAVVAAWLGIEPEKMQRYERVVLAPVDVA